MYTKTNYKNFAKEFLFQLALGSLVFILYSYGRHDRDITFQEFVFFTNQSLGALIIGFFLLPRFFYTQKYWHFAIYTTVVLCIVVFIEEAILERIYFPTTRGRNIAAKIYDLLDVLPTILILLGAKFAWDAITQRKHTKQLELLAKESELQFLKTQINPHFLFNNLNNLYAHAIENSPKTPEFILELSNMLRYMLYDCKATFVPLAREIEQLENFINLNKLQTEGKGKVTFNTNVSENNLKIAPLIFTVFVENAFKHSTSSLSKAIDIVIGLEVDEQNQLIFTCKNNFLNTSTTQDLNKGIGLKNVQKRLNMLYPNKHSLEVSNNNQEYLITLKINLQ
ncbi:histidine kinase [Wenyingzhuangia fucanilytica]|uniref:Histidine kinase n=1 Tax=Wenyingzhuangia fucanilytica TaxID=1790137 RepID=A0A1B1Y5K0_9FLAO|nr:histidine kinase [Wenyingzhuangia fucanilytica]ANW96056.1 histidine kinase [Wenyingzhuangia fucanilytica]